MESLWTPTPLTASGLPVMNGPPAHEQEIDLIAQADVSVMFGDALSDLKRGNVTLTTQRLLFANGPRQCCMSLGNIESARASSSIFGPAKVKMFLVGSGYMRLVFHRSGRDAFLEKLAGALKMKEWIPLATKKPEKQTVFTTHSAGISGIMRSVARDQKATDQAMQEAFSDLDSLMSNAKQMVDLAERFHSAQSAEEQDEFMSILHQLGIPNPVTKQTAGSSYHVLLARQLADFLLKVLATSAGMIMLIDVYCMFNRARSTELVSPDDVINSCKLFPELGIPLSLKQFQSGVLAVQSASHDDHLMSLRIVELIEANGPLTDIQLSHLLHVSIALASEHLLTAEQSLHLCRDTTTEATRFYKNIFM
ncbi:unnamed protein product (mitochondrion) [Plasmodiophora brassicae]|uniref:Vacuolar protein-sorting-associated protein 36 n=1 Tax=Plasmodiophora brassicae TaxID=37360 RepID=A0A0G4IIG2_PLABS|nr:hypothetical protein PBRA_003767 [Plasmodiophora brassicae]SPQ94285.1 unnamed protein product [Plasmodiophora brassicae]